MILDIMVEASYEEPHFILNVGKYNHYQKEGLFDGPT